MDPTIQRDPPVMHSGAERPHARVARPPPPHCTPPPHYELVPLYLLPAASVVAHFTHQLSSSSNKRIKKIARAGAGDMEVEYGCEGVMRMAVEEEQGWETPRRDDCRIPAVPTCPPPPPRKKPAVELGRAAPRREPPKGGYFQPPDIESLFMLAPPRRHAASTCA
ncbi:hypothetical protein ZWY2020_035765 [Hordeum vulgare]|nr:hypothetical protein ZWY2020_018757 [Hordeum vulgare]KAI5013512.1 hypothetical protein ZWY2020_035765 [Hordeum vulgare]